MFYRILLSLLVCIWTSLRQLWEGLGMVCLCLCEMGIVLPETVNSRTTGFYDSMTSVLWRMLNGWMQPLTFDLLRQKCVGFFCFVFVFGCKLLLLQKSAYILITFSLKWICLQNSPWWALVGPQTMAGAQWSHIVFGLQVGFFPLFGHYRSRSRFCQQFHTRIDWPTVNKVSMKFRSCTIAI